ncbi:MAG: DUF6526 family protein [Chitinophagaceae bacterium]
MKEQNFKNHVRFVFTWHIITGLSIIAVIVGSIINLVNATKETRYSASLLVLISFILVSIFMYARSFALKAQDRAIRAEENFRHFILTGEPHHKDIRLRQAIALRFASDDEMPALAQRAVDEKLSPREIKIAIQNWRPDYRRV